MNELNYIGADELVFNNDTKEGIHSGGFSVKSIMMKAGMSPIMTINNEQMGGSNEKVSDLFDNLVVPNWTLSYNNRLVGGKYKEHDHDNSDSDDEVINDDLHDKLLELVKHHDTSAKGLKKKMTRKIKKNIIKKGGTKRKK
jgi:hypothetical protein